MSPRPIRLRHRNLPLLLLQARERVISQFRPILNANAITEQQWRVVRVLLDVPALEPREIGELCQISSPSLAGVLARMQELGFVVRQRLQRDQRRVRVSLTPRARALAARMAPQVDATYQRIEALLGADFSARFQQMLDELLATLRPHAARAAARSRAGGTGRLPYNKRVGVRHAPEQ
ncbi:MAG TPA: homoprotocatechuate degradation operon regulator HpaR [Steroidobacteraceae bacterium]|nr:homoprotocatechuate degradation operon regulator HpaR [Steroidobacteraceae bacterium]